MRVSGCSFCWAKVKTTYALDVAASLPEVLTATNTDTGQTTSTWQGYSGAIAQGSILNLSYHDKSVAIATSISWSLLVPMPAHPALDGVAQGTRLRPGSGYPSQFIQHLPP